MPVFFTMLKGYEMKKKACFRINSEKVRALKKWRNTHEKAHGKVNPKREYVGERKKPNLVAQLNRTLQCLE